MSLNFMIINQFSISCSESIWAEFGLFLDVFRDEESLVSSLCFFSFSIRVVLVGKNKCVSCIFLHGLVNIILRIDIKVCGSTSSSVRLTTATIFCHGSDMSWRNLRNTREEETLSTHLVKDRQRPLPQLISKNLSHILKPKHIVLIWWLFKATIGCAAILCTNARGLLSLALHHFYCCQVVIHL